MKDTHMKRSRQAAGGFVKRQRVDSVGVLLNRLTRLPIEILSQILKMASMPTGPAITYDKDFTPPIWNPNRWAGTERMRLNNWLWTRFITWNDGDYGDIIHIDRQYG